MSTQARLASRRPSRARLFVEALEDRTLPTVTLDVPMTAATVVSAGGSLAYTITLSNTGSSAGTFVSLSDALPSGLSLVSQSQTSGPSFTLGSSGNTVNNTIATFNAGATAVFVVNATASSSLVTGTSLHNTATAMIPGAWTEEGQGPPITWSDDVFTTAFNFGSVSVTNPGTQSSTEGGSVSLSISATGTGTLRYAAAGLPAGLAINPGTGSITGTVAAGAAANGPYASTVTAGNGTDSASKTFTWNVAGAISLTNPGTQTTAEGGSVSLSLSASGGGTKTYGARGLPPGLAINTSTGAITGTLAAGASANGPYSVTVTAADGTCSDSETFTWNATGPVTLAAIADQTNTEGNIVSLSVSGSGSGTLRYGAVGLPHGLSISTGTGAICGTLPAGAADDGPYAVTLTVGNGTYAASRTFLWTVASPIALAAPADRTDDEGDSVSLTVSATNTAGGTLTYGAVNLPSGLSLNPSTGGISGTVSVGAAAQGPFAVTLFATNGTYRDTASFTWDVESPVTITSPGHQSGDEGDTVSLTVTGNGSGTLTYSATGLPTGLSINSSTGAITGTITASGRFHPTVTVGNGTYSASAEFDWDVDGAITISDPGSPAYNAGDAVSLPVVAGGGGTKTYSASGLPSGLSIHSSTGVISGTISSGLSAGVYTTTLTVTDGTYTAKRSFDWTVYPVSTVMVASPGPLTNAEGDSVSVAIGGTYSGSGTLRYAAVGLPAGLTMNPSNGSISGYVAAGASQFGPYAVTVTMTDGTASDSQYFTWAVTSPISLTNPGTQSSPEGGSVSLSLSASYGGTLTYSASGLPAGLAINPSTGSITGTVAAGAAAQAPYSVTVSAASGSYVATRSFTWNVSGGISITAPSNQTTNEGIRSRCRSAPAAAGR